MIKEYEALPVHYTYTGSISYTVSQADAPVASCLKLKLCTGAGAAPPAHFLVPGLTKSGEYILCMYFIVIVKFRFCQLFNDTQIALLNSLQSYVYDLGIEHSYIQH